MGIQVMGSMDRGGSTWEKTAKTPRCWFKIVRNSKKKQFKYIQMSKKEKNPEDWKLAQRIAITPEFYEACCT